MNDAMRPFFLSSMTLQRNLDGVDHALSVKRPPGGGAPINWVIGHVIRTRCVLMGMLGAEPMWGEGVGEAYDRGADPEAVADDFMPLDDLVSAVEESQGRLEAALASVSDEQLGKTLENPHPILGETLGHAVIGLGFHEAYHMGQIGTIRRALGLPGAI